MTEDPTNESDSADNMPIAEPEEVQPDKVKVGDTRSDTGVDDPPSAAENDASGKAEVKGSSQPKGGEPKKTPAAAEGEDKSAQGDARPKAPSAKDLLKEDLGEFKVRRAKGSKNVHSGIVSILATFNNTKVTFSDKSGNVISWSSAGKCGFRGSRKVSSAALLL